MLNIHWLLHATPDLTAKRDILFKWFLASKETALPRRWNIVKQKLGFIKRVD